MDKKDLKRILEQKTHLPESDKKDIISFFNKLDMNGIHTDHSKNYNLENIEDIEYVHKLFLDGKINCEHFSGTYCEYLLCYCSIKKIKGKLFMYFRKFLDKHPDKFHENKKEMLNYLLR